MLVVSLSGTPMSFFKSQTAWIQISVYRHKILFTENRLLKTEHYRASCKSPVNMLRYSAMQYSIKVCARTQAQCNRDNETRKEQAIHRLPTLIKSHDTKLKR